MAHKSLSIPEWHDLALQGVNVPTRILIGGRSMFPLVRYQKDYVSIIPVSGTLSVGDIVLIADPARKRYVIHRAWQIEEGRILTWGDNCPAPDGWMPMDRIWGKVVLVERGKRTITPDRDAGMRLARFWHPVGKIWRWAGRVSRPLRRKIHPKN